MVPFYGFDCLKATEPLRGDSLLFTTQFPRFPNTHLINLGRMKDWVNLGVTKWFWAWDPWNGNSVPWPPGHYHSIFFSGGSYLIHHLLDIILLFTFIYELYFRTTIWWKKDGFTFLRHFVIPYIWREENKDLTQHLLNSWAILT